MLKVNENTYITVAEADELIALYVEQYNPLRSFWEALDETEKEKYLLHSVEEMERLIISGSKTMRRQNLSFPRYPSLTVPNEIKLAQAYNALGVLNNDIKSAAETMKKICERYGVLLVGNSAGNAPISNDKPLSSRFTLASNNAAKIVTKYACGGFRMR